MIDPKSIERLKAQTDIVDIVGHYLPLKKSGANFVCVCPFHDDKNPSMSVSPSRGIFHCFSCKAGGDAIKFVMDYEKLSYPEAVEKIAGLQNFTLNYVRGGEPAKENKHILENANAFYRSLLYKTPAAVEYLYSRGITDELIDKFELGFAPESAQTIRLLQNEQIEPKEALEVGIVKQNENGIYASFINRITFPIYTHAGRLVGFGGRTISGNPAKYVNSPQSAVFDKSTLFYGYHLAKREIFSKNQIIITEGYMDVIMLHKAGFDNVVAVLGTALTTKHLPLLKRGEISVILCFDGDDAGINAATKSALLLAQNEIDASVVIIEGGADPADMVVAGKIEYLRQIFESGTEIGGGSIRIHRRDVQERVFKVMGITQEQAQEKFGFLLDAFAFGAPPHGGIAFGWDRIVALLSGAESIREVIAFPKSGGGYDPLTAAPAPITAQQRREAGVDSKPSEKNARS